MLAPIVVMALLGATVLLFVASIRRIPEGQAYTLRRVDGHVRTLGAGTHLILPLIERRSDGSFSRSEENIAIASSGFPTARFNSARPWRAGTDSGSSSTAFSYAAAAASRSKLTRFAIPSTW